MGKMVQEPVWIAEDGKRFATETQMLKHEGALKYAEHVKEYVESIDFGDMNKRAAQSQRTRISSAIFAYLAWAYDNEFEEEGGEAAAG